MNAVSRVLIVAALLMVVVVALRRTRRCVREEGFEAPSAAIINGQNAEWKKYPFYCAITERGEFAGGGALINPLYVLTAAHVVNKPTGILEVQVYPGKTVGIVDTIKYPLYVGDIEYDIALVKLAQPVLDVKPVALATAVTNVGRLMTVIGRGRQADGSYGTFQENQHPIKFAGDFFNFTSSKGATLSFQSVTSAGSQSQPCHGDSGGPIFVKDHGRNAPQVMSVVSRGDCRKISWGPSIPRHRAWIGAAMVRDVVCQNHFGPSAMWSKPLKLCRKRVQRGGSVAWQKCDMKTKKCVDF